MIAILFLRLNRNCSYNHKMDEETIFWTVLFFYTKDSHLSKRWLCMYLEHVMVHDLGAEGAFYTCQIWQIFLFVINWWEKRIGTTFRVSITQTNTIPMQSASWSVIFFSFHFLWHKLNCLCVCLFVCLSIYPQLHVSNFERG